MKEKVIEKYLKTQVKKLGGLAYKFSSPMHRGVPDQIVIFEGGDITFVEVKAATGRLSKLQAICFRELKYRDCEVVIVWSKEDVDEFLKCYKDK